MTNYQFMAAILVALDALLILGGCGEANQRADDPEEKEQDERVWPNQDVSRTSTSGSVEACSGDTSEPPYFGTYRIETTCGDGMSVVVSVDDVWYEAEAFRPLVHDTVVPKPYPALLGTIFVTEGAPFWQNAYFYAQCSPEFGPPPGGIAFDLVRSDEVKLSCHAGLGHDAYEPGRCLAFLTDGTIEQEECTVTAIPLDGSMHP